MRPAATKKTIKRHVTIRNQVSHPMARRYQPAYIKAAWSEVWYAGWLITAPVQEIVCVPCQVAGERLAACASRFTTTFAMHLVTGMLNWAGMWAVILDIGPHFQIAGVLHALFLTWFCRHRHSQWFSDAAIYLRWAHCGEDRFKLDDWMKRSLPITWKWGPVFQILNHPFKSDTSMLESSHLGCFWKIILYSPQTHTHTHTTYIEI